MFRSVRSVLVLSKALDLQTIAPPWWTCSTGTTSPPRARKYDYQKLVFFETFQMVTMDYGKNSYPVTYLDHDGLGG